MVIYSAISEIKYAYRTMKPDDAQLKNYHDIEKMAAEGRITEEEKNRCHKLNEQLFKEKEK